MNYQEKWNKICEYFERYQSESEDFIQNLWEKLFSEIFGYSSLDEEIESHRKIQLGSSERLIPDIIIKNKDEDLFMVELKREVLNIDESRKKQLYSYLKQEHNDLGILICNQICIIDYDYNNSDDEQQNCIIDFERDNPFGIRFVEIFTKCNFSKDCVKSFIRECIQAKSKAEIIKNQLTPELLKQLIIDHFSNDYSEVEIQNVLSKYVIQINLRNNTNYVSSSKVTSSSLFVRQNTNNGTRVEKTEKEKLIRDINSVGKETFVKYFEYYNNPNFETRDIRELFEKYENFSKNSMASKASTGKGIIKKGYAREALEIIAEANIDSSLREKAKEYLSRF